MIEDTSREQSLLLAIVQQAYRDLLVEDSGYKVEGMDCMCLPGKEDHHVKGKCPRAKPYEIKSAREWVEECSLEEWGFGWVCIKLGREPEKAKEGILRSVEEAKSADKLSRMNRIG